MIAQGAGAGGQAIACLTLLAVVFIPMAIVKRREIVAAYRDVTRDLP